ncbi:MbtH family NRPS accessory protein [Labrenzia sp. DG1229]|uniref:MbtH family protein n=1 Tax=Labrenzia sp. DG1229 TaxID=681847 RepID=UPI0009FE9481|nr:MbtH family NRPS accessory protein [Labrenzia sp. DG1229]
MSNPFEINNHEYYVLANHESQHSMWPIFCPVPRGWIVVHGPKRRQDCLDYIAENWMDLRPKSLADKMAT